MRMNDLFCIYITTFSRHYIALLLYLFTLTLFNITLHSHYKVSSLHREKYCAQDAPAGVIISTNKLTMAFSRKQFKSNEFSGGLLCEIYTVGGMAIV